MKWRLRPFFYCEALAAPLALCVDLCAALFPVPERDLAAWCVALLGAGLAGRCAAETPRGLVAVDPARAADPPSDPVLDPSADVLRRCPLGVLTGAGSATWSRRPGTTRMPEGIAFQRRNWLKETPKRSAIVTSVSPRRTM